MKRIPPLAEHLEPLLHGRGIAQKLGSSDPEAGSRKLLA